MVDPSLFPAESSPASNTHANLFQSPLNSSTLTELTPDDSLALVSAKGPPKSRATERTNVASGTRTPTVPRPESAAGASPPLGAAWHGSKHHIPQAMGIPDCCRITQASEAASAFLEWMLL